MLNFLGQKADKLNDEVWALKKEISELKEQLALAKSERDYYKSNFEKKI